MKTQRQLNELLNQMTTEEKIGQLIQLNGGFFAETKAEITGPARDFGIEPEEISRVGSLLNFDDADHAISIQKRHLEEDRNRIPLLFMMDVIHGYRTMYPIPLAMGASFSPSLMEDCAHMAATEAAADGVQVTFAPMVDFVRDPRWGRVLETCGEDAFLNSVMGQAQVRGFQGDDVAAPDRLVACVKHFAGYGGAEAGRDYNTVEISERLLREYYFPAYKACIDAGVKMLMPSFNSLNGIPSTANRWLMQGVLREEWGFDGVVVSDYNAIEELVIHGVAEDEKAAARMAFGCGCHIGMMSSAYHAHLKSLLDEGAISMEALDEAVLKILSLKNELGLFDDPYHGASRERAEQVILSETHRALARKAAEECAVLLKNDGILPLSEDIGKVAVIGPFAEDEGIKGNWACHGSDEECVSPAAGIKALLGEERVIVARGCNPWFKHRTFDLFDEAIAAAKEADAVILCLGEPQDYSGESHCRVELTLPNVQVDLAKAIMAVNPNTVVLLFNGRPLTLTELDATVPAILDMWFPGTEGGAAAANLLFGRVNPSGKVTMSFPKAVGQCPIYYNHPSTGRPKQTPEDEFQVCASNYRDCGNLPLYSFGHGLSYSHFTYEALTLDTDSMTADTAITVTVTLRNDSEREGQEVVQLYLHDLVASTVRPVQSLIGFEKVKLAAGERKTVTFSITEPMLRFCDFDGKFISEAGEFTVSAGYADHLILTRSFRLR